MDIVWAFVSRCDLVAETNGIEKAIDRSGTFRWSDAAGHTQVCTTQGLGGGPR